MMYQEGAWAYGAMSGGLESSRDPGGTVRCQSCLGISESELGAQAEVTACWKPSSIFICLPIILYDRHVHTGTVPVVLAS